MKRTLFALIVCLFIMLSCSTVKKTKDLSGISVLPQHKENLKTLNLTAKLIPTFKDFNNTVLSKIKISGIDSMSMSIIGPMGITVGKMYSRSDYFIFYSTFENTAYEGNPSADNLKKAARMPISFEDYVHLIRCEPPGNPSDYLLAHEDSGNPKKLFRNESDESYVEYALFSSSDNSLVQYQRKLRDGTLVLSAFFRDYEEFGGFRLARTIQMKFPELEGMITMEFENIEVNKHSDEPYSFKIPPSVKRNRMD